MNRDLCFEKRIFLIALIAACGLILRCADELVREIKFFSDRHYFPGPLQVLHPRRLRKLYNEENFILFDKVSW
jgi:hypothetical protein